MSYTPLPSEVTIYKSQIHNLGLFSTKNILPNTFLGLTHIFDGQFKDNYIRTPLGGFYNHSENPNCISIESNELIENIPGSLIEISSINTCQNGKYRYLITKDMIQKGEELTCNYKLYEI